jgi:IclR family acetate operon transcriptional repressor
MRMFTTVGAAVLAHTTASGKAMLAQGQPDSVVELYSKDGKLERLTPRTLTTVEALQKDLERIARRGYAIDNEEHEEGVSCVAAAIFDHTDRPCGAISISAPTARIVHADTSELGSLLREHAAEISADLGHGSSKGDGARRGSRSRESG